MWVAALVRISALLTRKMRLRLGLAQSEIEIRIE